MNKTTKFIVFLFIVIPIALGSYILLKDTAEAPTEREFEQVSIFLGQKGTENIIPVEQKLEKGSGIEKRTLEKLLAGLSDEQEQSYFTLINPGVTIQSFEIKNKIAYVDFSEELEREVGGSARVLGIREQIEKTLLQFKSIEQVIISIDGRTEDILQP